MSSLKYPRWVSRYCLVFLLIIIVYRFSPTNNQNNYNNYGVTAACSVPPTLSLATSLARHHREAIVTMLAGDSYTPGALVLAYTLQKYGAMTNRDCILFIPYVTTISSYRLAMLAKLGWKITYLKPIQIPGRVIERYAHTLLKLYSWNMTEYDAIAIIDADSMLIGSIEEPFRLLRANMNISLLAVSDIAANELKNRNKSKRSCFNSGILFLRPNTQHFKELVCLSMDTTYYELKLPDQNLLNNYYHNQWIELPMIYNSIVNLLDDNFMSKDDWNNDTRILHFASHPKPWDKNAKSNAKSAVAFESTSIWRQYFAAMVSEYGWKNMDIF